MLLTPTADHEDGFISQLVQRWHAWKERSDGLARLERCGSSEVTRIAQDLALSPGELRALARSGTGAANLLYRRMDDLGLDRTLVEHSETSVLRDMQRACSLCTSKERCRHDFACGAAATAWHPYCPNDDTLAALVAGGAHRIRPGSTGVSPAMPIADDRRSAHRAWLGFGLIALAWLVLFALPRETYNGNLRQLAPIEPSAAAVAPTVDCLDASCLTAEQQTALRDLRTVQQQGWIASSAEEIAALPRIAALAQDVQSGEALACRRAGGATYYGFMYQNGCSAGGAAAARLDGFNECRPMASGGACLLQ